MRCSTCHAWGHTSADCADTAGAPLETPSHNGPWRGKIAPRVVPTGVCGSDLKSGAAWQQKASKGHQVQSRLAAQRKLQQRNLESRMSARKP